MKVLMALVVGLVLAGCAAGNGNGAGSTTTQEETSANGTEETTAYKEETTVLAGAEDYPRPPESTLSYGGREVKGTLGSYCWKTSGSSGACADAFFPIPDKHETLSVPSGSEMVFRPGRISSAYKVEAVAYPYATASKALQGNPAATKTIDSSRRSLKTHGSGIERTIPAEVPPGEYVVLVDLTVPREKTKFWDDNGAEYGFRIMVE